MGTSPPTMLVRVPSAASCKPEKAVHSQFPAYGDWHSGMVGSPATPTSFTSPPASTMRQTGSSARSSLHDADGRGDVDSVTVSRLCLDSGSAASPLPGADSQPKLLRRALP